VSLRFGGVQDAAGSDEFVVVSLEPLRVTGAGEEVRMSEDSGQEVEVCFNAGDDGVVDCTAGFTDNTVPCTSCDDDFRHDAVKIGSHGDGDAVDEGCVDASAVAGGKVEGLDLADTEGVVFLRIFGCDA
jgi:hypothetical protein